MHTSVKGVDPRVKRTRQLIQNAFMELMLEKGFPSISIQDIAERATVNRATFYAHFEDKYDLMDSIVREQFQRVVASKLPAEAKWGMQSLRLLIQAMLGFLGEFHNHCAPNTHLDPLLERAIQEEIYERLLAWLKQSSAARRSGRIPQETLAEVLSWAMFGPAVRWSREERTPSAAELTDQILLVLTEGIAHLTPDFQLE